MKVRDLMTQKVEFINDAITEGVTFCNETDDIKYVARLMEERQIRRVMVKDGQG